ncbi:MAG: hypothetical protein NTX17_04955 [Candidatus Eisenbacteria bacterium]|nr:hypothetical protein [Candidatus Eisenbacteria bacterium]
MIPEHLAQYDFRTNLIADPHNPVLIQKAWRDHFAGESLWKPGKDGGKAYLGVANSEDAMTWNVFRSLQIEGPRGLQVVSEVLGLSAVESVLFWGCDVEKHSEIQQLLSILIRTVDGQLRGTMTEPDLVLVTEGEVAFVECKLNLNGGQSPWKAQTNRSNGKESGAMRRMRSYAKVSGFVELESLKDWEDTYQLIRQYVYATRMADALRKQPVVVPVINGEHAGILKTFYSLVQDSPLNQGGVFRNLATWQDFSAKVACAQLACTARLITKMIESLDSSREKGRTRQ